jgi:hypothetical protein
MDEQELAHWYGPAPTHSEHQRGERVLFLDEGKAYTGILFWIGAAVQLEEGKILPMRYVIRADHQKTFPHIVCPGAIIERTSGYAEAFVIPAFFTLQAREPREKRPHLEVKGKQGMALPTLNETEIAWTGRTNDEGYHSIQDVFPAAETDRFHRANCRILIQLGRLQPEHDDPSQRRWDQKERYRRKYL